MFCHKCGNKLIEGGQFCPKCGTKQEQAEVMPTPITSSTSQKPTNSFVADTIKPVKVDFATRLLLFWLQGSVSVDGHAIRTSIAKSIIGDKDEKQFALGNVQGATVKLRHFFLLFALGIGSFIMGVWLLYSVAVGEAGEGFPIGIAFAFVIVGIILFLSGISTTFIIDGNGNQYKIRVPFYERRKIIEINEVIQKALLYREDKEVNVMRETSNNIVEAINRK